MEEERTATVRPPETGALRIWWGWMRTFAVGMLWASRSR
jgi:hypothetical protein